MVQVTDGNGAVAMAPVTVGAAVTITPADPAVAPLGPVQFAATGGSGTGFLWTLASDQSGGTMTAAGAYAAGATGKTVDVVHVVDSLGNVASAAVSVGGGLAIDPTSPSTPPKGAIVFTAVGGSGGFTWSLVTNASGATLDATSGAYVAGVAGNVSDVVGVKDSNGNTATTSVKVGSGIVVSPATAAVGTGFTPRLRGAGRQRRRVRMVARHRRIGRHHRREHRRIPRRKHRRHRPRRGHRLARQHRRGLGHRQGRSAPTGDAGADSGVADASSDAAPEHDAASGAGSGLALDAGAARDAAADGGSGTTPSTSCGCTVVDASASNVGGALGALLGLALVVRRRRRG